MNKELLRLAIPNIISNVSVPLLSTVDTVLMGKISVLHLGAIGLGAMIFNFLYWNFGFLRMGTTGQVAQAYGRSNMDEARELLIKSILISLGISAFLILLRQPLFKIGVMALSISADLEPMVSQYFNILIWGAPASLLIFTLVGWLFGMQNARVPMMITILMNGINIGLSYYLVYVRGQDIRGVAIGTLVAQYIGVFLLSVVIVYQYPLVRERSEFRGEWLTFLNVNRDLFIRTVALTFVFGFFYRQSSEAGIVVLAANIIFLQLLNWMSYGIDGFAYAAESLVGRFYGARELKELSHSIALSFRWGLGLALVFGLLYGVFYFPIMRLFTADPQVIDWLLPYRYWIALIPLGAFVCYIWDGVYIGLTASQAMRDTMLISLIFFLGIFAFLSTSLANAAWISLAGFLIFRGVLQFIWWRWKIRKRIFAT